MQKYPCTASVNWQITVMLLLSTAIAEKTKAALFRAAFMVCGRGDSNSHAR